MRVRRCLLVAGGLISVGAGVFITAHLERPAVAQQPAVELADPDIVFSENPEQAAADKALYESVSEAEAENFVADAHPDVMEVEAPSLRDEYVELLRRKAELMSDEEIAESLEQLQGDIAELEATRRLQAITDELRELVESHPETAAARRAEAMLAMHPDIRAESAPYTVEELKPSP